MAQTMYAQSLFGGGMTATNVPQGTARETVPAGPSNVKSNLPVLPGVAAAAGVSVPVLIALGVLAWWLFRVY